MAARPHARYSRHGRTTREPVPTLPSRDLARPGRREFDVIPMRTVTTQSPQHAPAPPGHRRNHRRRHRRRGGLLRRAFTLIETGLATMIIGLGVVSVLQLTTKLTVSQITAVDMTVAVNLANNLHELTYNLHFCDPNNPTHWGPENGETLATFNDNDDFDGQVFSPPIDARRNAISSLSGWSQGVTVHSVDINSLTTTVPNGSSKAQRITVTISHNGQAVYQESWLNVYPY